MTDIDITEIASWPQALVVLAVIIVPQIVTIVQNAAIKRHATDAAHELKNNSGSSVKDAVDRIEAKLTEHISQSDARFEELERAEGRPRS